MTKSLVTHLILTHNDWDYLEKMVSFSVQQKGLPKGGRETLIVDDGSKEPVAPKLKKIYDFKAHNIRVIRNQKNLGIIKTVEVGLKNVQTPYVHLGSSNDVIKENFFSEMVGILEKYKEAPFAFSDPGEFDEARNIYRNLPLFLSKKETFFPPADFAALYKKTPFHIGSNTILFRTPFVREVEIQKDLPSYGDWFLSYFLAFSKGCAYVPKHLTYYTIHEGAFSSSFSTKGLVKEIPRFLRKVKGRDQEAFSHLKESGFLSAFPFLPVLFLIFRDSLVREAMTFSSFKNLILRALWRQILWFLPLKVRRWIRQKVS